MCYSWDSTLLYFLSFLRPAHPLLFSISEAKSLSREHPQKPSTTIKHLAVDLCFHKCDKFNGATLFPANKSNQSFGLVHSGPVWFMEKSLTNWNRLKSVILCSLCSSRKLSCVEPRSLENRSSLYVLLLSASPRSYLFSEIELLQSNGNHAECCGTSFSHTTTV